MNKIDNQLVDYINFTMFLHIIVSKQKLSDKVSI